MIDLHKTNAQILQQLGLHKYYNTIDSVIIVQNKLYLLNKLINLQYDFILHQSGPFSRNLLEFIDNVYYNYSDISDDLLTPELENKIKLVNELKQEKLACMLGQKEVYKLLATMSYINDNLHLWKKQEHETLNTFDEYLNKELVYKILDKRENIYNLKVLDLAWEILESINIIERIDNNELYEQAIYS